MSRCKPNYDPCLDSKLNQIGSYASVARQSAESATASATAAAASATAAAASAEEAAQSAEAARLYLGAFAVAPTTNNEGGPLEEGMLYFNTVSNTMFVWDGVIWDIVASNVPSGGGLDKLFYENDIVMTTNYTITSGKNAMSAGPITVNSGVVLTIPAGSVYTIV